MEDIDARSFGFQILSSQCLYEYYDGYFEARGGSGIGVNGIATGRSGAGVFGWAKNTEEKIMNYGGLFRADSQYGRGVYGVAMGLSGEGIRSVKLIKRPIASATAAVSDPALPTLANTSKGARSPFSLIVI